MRPSSVLFEAIGSVAPFPCVKMWYLSRIWFLIRKSATAWARSSDNCCWAFTLPRAAQWPVIKRSFLNSFRISPIFSSFLISDGRSLSESGSNWILSKLIVRPFSPCFTEMLSSLYFSTFCWSFSTFSESFTDLYSVTSPCAVPLKIKEFP